MLIKDDSDEIRGAYWTLLYFLNSYLLILWLPVLVEAQKQKLLRLRQIPSQSEASLTVAVEGQGGKSGGGGGGAFCVAHTHTLKDKNHRGILNRMVL
jgi:hypothetical protein